MLVPFRLPTLLALLAWGAVVNAQGAGVIRLTKMEDVPSMTNHAEQLVREAYGRLGYTVAMTALPIARSVHAAEHGDYDGELCRTTQIESTSPHLVRVPAPVSILEYAPYVMEGTTADLSSWAAIRKSGLKVGARTGGRVTKQSLSGPQATFATSYASLLQMLLTGRIDVVVAPKGQLEQAFVTVPDKLREKLSLVQGRNAFTSEPMYHYVHERNAALVEPLAREIRRIEARAGVAPSLRPINPQ